MKKTCGYCIYVSDDLTKCWLKKGNEVIDITARKGIACSKCKLDESLHEVIFAKAEAAFKVCLNCEAYHTPSDPKKTLKVCSVTGVVVGSKGICGVWHERKKGDLIELLAKVSEILRPSAVTE